MMHPNDRQHLLEALRPPDGYAFDHAIGTTYSLDLMALLTVPVSFSFLNYERRDGEPVRDPLALMHALRRSADRIDLFCQAGRTEVPPRGNRLLTVFLERSVHMVQPPGGGVFHPKVWILRFVDDEGGVLYRCLVLTRNLTHDRSWDALVCIEGVPSLDRVNAYAVNHPLGNFIESLPGLALHAIGDERATRIARIAHELRRTVFEVPEGFDDLQFHAWLPGTRPRNPLLKAASVVTIISPFLSESLLRAAFDGARETHLVSRTSSLDALGDELLEACTSVHVLDGALESDLQNGEDGDEGDAERPVLYGLHAKIHILEYDRRARVLVGSANATSAAFSRNVEFMVELGGMASRHGAKALFAEGAAGETSFRDLLRPYIRSGTPAEPDDFQEFVDAARREVMDALLAADLSLTCSDAEGGAYLLTLAAADALPLLAREGVRVRCRPFSLGEPYAQEIRSGMRRVVFGPLSFNALTSFMAFEIEAARGGRVKRECFILNLPLHGAPDDRLARVIVEIVRDPSQFMRLLLMILGHGDAVAIAGMGADNPAAVGSGWLPMDGAALFEQLVRAACRHPHRIDEIDAIVRSLEDAGTGESVLPAGFMEIWHPIRTARKELHA